MERSVERQSAPADGLVHLSEVTDPSIAGAKAVALGNLLRAGFSAPPGLVIPADCVASAGGPDASPDPAFVSALSAALAQFNDQPLAVRSSGVAEDLDDASHAGQYETILNVQGVDNVLDAIRTVAGSATSSQIAQYRAAVSGGATRSSDIAILIQPMVLPDAAGVAFSANPVTGDRGEVVINAVRGLGDRLMDGEASAEEWTVRGEAAALTSDDRQVLNADEARRIARLARSVEELFGTPQDVEWALADGELLALQARPITALPLKPDLPPLEGFWTKELEHFQSPVSMMMFSIHRSNIKEASRDSFKAFGLIIECLELAYRAGEIYERDLPIGGKDGGADPPPWWVLGALVRVIPELRQRMKLAREAVRSDLEAQLLQRWDTTWKHELAETAARIRQVDLSALSNVALADHLLTAREFTRRGFHIHFQLAPPCLLPVYRLVKLAESLFGWSEHDALRLVHGSSYGSSEGSEDLDRIADIIRRDERAMEQFSSPATTLDDLQVACPAIFAEIDAHLSSFGVRMIQNDPMSPTYQEMPWLTLKFLRDRLSGAASRQQQSAASVRQAAMEEAETLLSMRSAADRARFEHTLKRAAWAYGLRDSNVFLTLGQPWALLRFALLETGQRLEALGTLHVRDDIFWCEFEETHAAISGRPPAGLADTARRRRLEALWACANPGPLSFGTEPALPDVRGLPREAREVHEAMLWGIARLRAPQQASAGQAGAITGVPASPGRYQGVVRIIRNEREFHKLQPGDVLVCPTTSSSWAVLFGAAGALVTDQGGSLSHPAIIAREHGIPAVVATVRATETLKEGQLVIVDGSNGRVELVEAR